MWQYFTFEYFGIFALVLFVGKIVQELWDILYSCYLGRAMGHSLKPRELGKWAVITGASDGIGKAYAEELAAEGVNTVLISRSLTKLQAVAAEIERQYGVETLVIDVDFTKGDDIYDRITRELTGLEIGVLVNNVGMSYKYPEYLHEIPDVLSFSRSIINCNSSSVANMCAIVVGQMVKRRKGLILNVSSCSAVLPTPLMCLYSGAKAFVYKFSEDMALEYAPFGVKVQCVLPAFVATKMSGFRNTSLQIPSTRDFARNQMNSWGLECSSPGWWFHKLEWIYYLRLSKIFPSAMVKVTLNWLLMLRNRALKRQREKERKVEMVHSTSDPVKISRVEHDLNEIWPAFAQIPPMGIELTGPGHIHLSALSSTHRYRNERR